MKFSTGTDFTVTRVSKNRVMQTEKENSSLLFTLPAQEHCQNRGKKLYFPRGNTRNWHQCMMGGAGSCKNISEVYNTILMIGIKYCCPQGSK